MHDHLRRRSNSRLLISAIKLPDDGIISQRGISIHFRNVPLGLLDKQMTPAHRNCCIASLFTRTHTYQVAFAQAGHLMMTKHDAETAPLHRH